MQPVGPKFIKESYDAQTCSRQSLCVEEESMKIHRKEDTVLQKHLFQILLQPPKCNVGILYPEAILVP